MRFFLILNLFTILLFSACPAFGSSDIPLTNKVLVVDPGHGGYDPGTVKGEIYEKNINLSIAKKIKSELANHGVKVILTHDDDYNLAIPGLHSQTARRYDLNKRLELINKSQASLYISIHVNSNRIRSCQGAEVYYYKGSEKGKQLAQHILWELQTIPGMKHRGLKENDYFVLRKTKTTAVLVEVGYLSNPIERKKLVEENYQLLLASKISHGILRYIENPSNVLSHSTKNN